MTITLSPELEAQVRKDAAASGYEEVENYVRAVLWGSPDLNGWIPDDPEAFHARLDESCMQADRGELIGAEEVKSQMQEMKNEWHKSRSAA